MSVTGSVRGFTEFDDLVKGYKGYSSRLESLFSVCSENKDTRHPISFEESESRLVLAVKSALQSFEIEGKTIAEFVIGKSYVKQRTGVTFRPDRHTTWTLGGGINNRWRFYQDNGYDGLVVLCCIERDMIPKNIMEKINFQYEDEDGRKQKFLVDQQVYALALEQRLIHHFMFVEPDNRLRNHSIDCGNKSTDNYKGGIVYLAYKLKEATRDGDLEKDPDSPQRELHVADQSQWCSFVITMEETTIFLKIRSFEKADIQQIIRRRFDLKEDQDFDIETQVFDTWAVVLPEDLPDEGKLVVKLKRNISKSAGISVGIQRAKKEKAAKPQVVEQQDEERMRDSGPQIQSKKTVSFDDKQKLASLLKQAVGTAKAHQPTAEASPKVFIKEEITENTTGSRQDSLQEWLSSSVGTTAAHSPDTFDRKGLEPNENKDKLLIKNLFVGRNIRGPLKGIIQDSSETVVSAVNIFQRVLRDESGVIKIAISNTRLLKSIKSGQEYLIYNFDVTEISPYLCGVVIGENSNVTPVPQSFTGKIASQGSPQKRKAESGVDEQSPVSHKPRVEPDGESSDLLSPWKDTENVNEPKTTAPKRSKAEKKVILEEMLRLPSLSSTKDHDIVFQQVLARKEHLDTNVRVYYEKLLESSKGKDTLRTRVVAVIRDTGNGKLMEKEKDAEIIKLIHAVCLRKTHT